jgi:hypothetical protein
MKHKSLATFEPLRHQQTFFSGGSGRRCVSLEEPGSLAVKFFRRLAEIEWVGFHRDGIYTGTSVICAQVGFAP